MRVDLSQELDPGDDTLEMPWTSPANPAVKYMDLKVQPDLIDLIWEAVGRPVIASFLTETNSSSSAFRTAKCDVWTTTELAEDEKLDFGLPHKVGSYFDLVFDSPESNSRLEAQLELGAKLERKLGGLRVQAQVEICVRRCRFQAGDRWGYYVTLFIHGYGATQAEAEGEWSRALAAVKKVLGEISAKS